MVNDDKKTKRQLIEELADLRQKVKQDESAHGQNAKSSESDKFVLGKLAFSLDNIQDGLVQLDKLGIIVDVNQAAVDIFGGSKDELIGKHFTQIGIFSLKEIPTLLNRFEDSFSHFLIDK